MGFRMENNSMLRRNGYVTSRNLSSRLVPVETLKPLGRESRKHPASQIRKLGESIERLESHPVRARRFLRAFREGRGEPILNPVTKPPGVSSCPKFPR